MENDKRYCHLQGDTLAFRNVFHRLGCSEPSVIGIFIPNVTDKLTVFHIPALEVFPGNPCQIAWMLWCDDFDILFCHVEQCSMFRPDA